MLNAGDPPTPSALCPVSSEMRNLERPIALFTITNGHTGVVRDETHTPAVQLVPQDDPSLLPPQPLILDPQLRFPLSARILSEWNKYRGSRELRDDRILRDSRDVPDARGPAVVRQPWIVCGDTVPPERREEVERAGARVVPTQLDGSGECGVVWCGVVRVGSG